MPTLTQPSGTTTSSMVGTYVQGTSNIAQATQGDCDAIQRRDQAVHEGLKYYTRQAFASDEEANYKQIKEDCISYNDGADYGCAVLYYDSKTETGKLICCKYDNVKARSTNKKDMCEETLTLEQSTQEQFVGFFGADLYKHNCIKK